MRQFVSYLKASSAELDTDNKQLATDNDEDWLLNVSKEGHVKIPDKLKQTIIEFCNRPAPVPAIKVSKPSLKGNMDNCLIHRDPVYENWLDKQPDNVEKEVVRQFMKELHKELDNARAAGREATYHFHRQAEISMHRHHVEKEIALEKANADNRSLLAENRKLKAYLLLLEHPDN